MKAVRAVPPGAATAGLLWDWKCSACRRRFAEPRLLREHYRQRHPEHRPFACELCADTFRDGEELLAHRQAHALQHQAGPPSPSNCSSSQVHSAVEVSPEPSRESSAHFSLEPCQSFESPRARSSTAGSRAQCNVAVSPERFQSFDVSLQSFQSPAVSLELFQSSTVSPERFQSSDVSPQTRPSSPQYHVLEPMVPLRGVDPVNEQRRSAVDTLKVALGQWQELGRELEGELRGRKGEFGRPHEKVSQAMEGLVEGKGDFEEDADEEELVSEDRLGYFSRALVEASSKQCLQGEIAIYDEVSKNAIEESRSVEEELDHGAGEGLEIEQEKRELEEELKPEEEESEDEKLRENTSKRNSLASSFKCSECPKAYTRKSQLKEHLRTHSGERPFSCSLCPKKFARRGVLNVHLRLHSGEMPFECSKCLKKFRQKVHLVEHLLMHKRKGSPKPKSPTVHECEECGKRFSHKGSLTVHLRIHSGERPHECEHCDQKFSSRGGLIRHLRMHTGDRPFHCSECGGRFRQKSVLDKHLKGHAGVLPFGCDHCPKKFSQKTHLEVHLRTHSGERPFQCSQCDMKFIKNSRLKEHMLRHTKTYECSDCGRKFDRSNAYKIHVKTHSDVRKRTFKCSQCPVEFPAECKLKYHHRRMHTEEKPYECEVCLMKFSDRSNMRAHRQRHTSQKQFKCDACQKNFARKKQFEDHVESHKLEKSAA